MLKVFCDRCGSEITNYVYSLSVNSKLVEFVLDPLSSTDSDACGLMNQFNPPCVREFCETCMKEIAACASMKVKRGVVNETD